VSAGDGKILVVDGEGGWGDGVEQDNAPTIKKNGVKLFPYVIYDVKFCFSVQFNGINVENTPEPKA